MNKLLIIIGIASLTAMEAHAWIPESLSMGELHKLHTNDEVEVSGGKCGFGGTFIGKFLKTTKHDFDKAGEAIDQFYPEKDFPRHEYALKAANTVCNDCSKDAELDLVEYEFELDPKPAKPVPTEEQKDSFKFRVICIKD